MKRITVTTLLFACALLAATASSYAQATTPTPQVPQSPAPAAPDWFTGNVNLLLLGHDDVSSSKFEEYRVVPKGASMPLFSIMGSQKGYGFALLGQKIYQDDQRYTGWANTSWVGVAFDYNQIPHNMGNNGRTIHTEVAPGVWTIDATVRKALGDAVDATPTTGRNYPFYLNLLSPTIATANFVDVSGLRKRADVTFDLGKQLPFGLEFTYTRDHKSGYRGASGGDILGVVTSAVDVLEPLDEVTQDFGVRWNWNIQKKGNVRASFNRNVFSNDVGALIVDNPFRATDLAYTSTAVPGGPAQARFSTAPDNEAIRGAFGASYKFARQTRVTADLAFGSWTQDAQFLPYTINSAIFTSTGLPANASTSLQQQSLDGKINTASYNFSFSSRPMDPLTVRARYRNYSYEDKSARYVITGDTSASPDRSWGAANAPTADEPYGHATANRTDSSTGRFDITAGYDFRDLTFEAGYRNIQSSWEGRVASSGTDGSENGFNLAALYHARDWVGLRFQFDSANRTVSGIEAASVGQLQGIMADHAERDQTRIGFDVELTPSDKYGVTLAYFRRNDDYPNRPFEVAGNPDTESGLLEASFDMFSLDFNYVPNARAELAAFYTYEKLAETKQFVTLTSGALNNVLRYSPWDKGHTFGFNGRFHIVPEKWTFGLLVQQQDVDGFMDITAREAGSFYTPGRTTLIPAGQGGAADIDDHDDMKQTTAVADLAYSFAKGWTFSFGYAYDKYTNADAMSDGTTIFPQSVLFFLKENDGDYTANMLFTRLSYRW